MQNDGLDTLPRATDSVTIAEAYRAMLRVLEYYHSFGPNDEVGAILGDLSTDIWADRSPGDPASWSRWLDAIDKKDLRMTPDA